MVPISDNTNSSIMLRDDKTDQTPKNTEYENNIYTDKKRKNTKRKTTSADLL